MGSYCDKTNSPLPRSSEGDQIDIKKAKFFDEKDEGIFEKFENDFFKEKIGVEEFMNKLFLFRRSQDTECPNPIRIDHLRRTPGEKDDDKNDYISKSEFSDFMTDILKIKKHKKIIPFIDIMYETLQKFMYFFYYNQPLENSEEKVIHKAHLIGFGLIYCFSKNYDKFITFFKLIDDGVGTGEMYDFFAEIVLSSLVFCSFGLVNAIDAYADYKKYDKNKIKELKTQYKICKSYLQTAVNFCRNVPELWLGVEMKENITYEDFFKATKKENFFWPFEPKILRLHYLEFLSSECDTANREDYSKTIDNLELEQLKSK